MQPRRDRRAPELTAGGRDQHLVITEAPVRVPPLRQHFGLGSGRAAERLEVWVAGRKRETFERLPSTRRLRLPKAKDLHGHQRGPNPI